MMSVKPSPMAEFDFLNDTSTADQLVIPPLTNNQPSSVAIVGSNQDDFLGLMGTATSIPHNGLAYSLQPSQSQLQSQQLQGSVSNNSVGVGGNNYPPPQYAHHQTLSYQNHHPQQQTPPYTQVYAVQPHLTRYPNPIPNIQQQPQQQHRTAIYTPQSYQQPYKQQQPSQQQQQLMPGNIILRPGASVIAPGMLSHAAERKHIPDTNDNEGIYYDTIYK